MLWQVQHQEKTHQEETYQEETAPPEDGGLLAAPPAKRDDSGKQMKREGGKIKITTASLMGL